jgi:hypothetical protein
MQVKRTDSEGNAIYNCVCKESEEKQPVCCYPDCNEKAEFHLQELGMGTTYEDYTELCSKHLDEMIPFGSSFEVWRLDN